MNRAKLRQSLRSDPQVSTTRGSGWVDRRVQDRSPTFTHELIKQRLPIISPAFIDRDKPKLHQRIVQLVSVIRLRPGFFAHAIDRRLVQFPEVGGGFGIDKSSIHHRQRAPFFRRRVVEKRVGLGRQNFLCQGRRLNHLSRDQASLTALDRSQQVFKPSNIHCLFQAIANRLRHQRMRGNLNGPG